ncbi:MAG: RES domain-containing protein [Deltaproteobacteria bacterium]|nr:RES domain-containing protein [Deltaproteobacteria bacterium]
MIRVWRVSEARHAAAFDGEGARKYGGRWNLPGTAVVYAAESLSLALLELYVHLDPEDIPASLAATSAELPEDISVERWEQERLPSTWRDLPVSYRTQQLGTAWAESRRTCVLIVPSSVVPQEDLYVANPAHPEFPRIVVGEPEAFSLDPRLTAHRRP